MSEAGNTAELITDKRSGIVSTVNPFGLPKASQETVQAAKPIKGRRGQWRVSALGHTDRPWLAALSVALYADGVDEHGVARKLRAIAEKTVQMALDGNQFAIAEVSQRLDGKVAQAVEMTGISMENPEALTRTQLMLGLVQLAKAAGLVSDNVVDVTPERTEESKT